MKKLLALVLALVMTLSLCTISNAAFTDAKDVDASYEEAVAVLNGMGVFKGYEDGSFKPEGSITRAEVAAIVYRLYTGDVKDKQAGLYAGYGKFNDMAGAAWATGYIGFCANAGFVKGYGDGKFGPSDPVTGYQALAMILRAVGYGKNGEFEGADWELHVAQIAQQVGALKNVKGVSLKAAASRQLVAELLFQVAAYVPTVTYTPAFGYVTADIAKDVKDETLGWKNFYLAQSKDGEDAWGRPSNKWFEDKNGNGNVDSKETKYATIAAKPVMTFTEATTQCDIADNLGESKKVYLESEWDNGKQGTVYTNKAKHVYADATKTALKDAKGAQGQIVEIYDMTEDEDENNYYRVVVIDTYLAKVTAVSELKTDKNDHVTKNAKIELQVFGGLDFNLESSKENFEYEKGDYVLVNVNKDKTNEDSEIIGIADTLVAKQTKLIQNADKHVIDGTTYMDACQFDLDAAKMDTNDDYTWYFDQFGNVIGNTSIYNAKKYAVISSIEYVDVVKGDDYVQADLVYMDGTTAEDVVVKSISGDPDISYDAAENAKFWDGIAAALNDLYEVSVDSKTEKVTLTKIDTEYYKNIKTGIPTKFGGAAYTDNTTTYLVQTAEKDSKGKVTGYTYESVVGYENIASYTDDEARIDIVTYAEEDDYDTKVVKYAYVVGTADEDTTTVEGFAYITKDEYEVDLEEVTKAGYDYYDVTVAGLTNMNGEAMTLTFEVPAIVFEYNKTLTLNVITEILKSLEGKLAYFKTTNGVIAWADIFTDFREIDVNGTVAKIEDVKYVATALNVDSKTVTYNTDSGVLVVDGKLYNVNKTSTYIADEDGEVKVEDLTNAKLAGKDLYIIAKNDAKKVVLALFITDKQVADPAEGVLAAAQTAAKEVVDDFVAEILTDTQYPQFADVTAADLAAAVAQAKEDIMDAASVAEVEAIAKYDGTASPAYTGTGLDAIVAAATAAQADADAAAAAAAVKAAVQSVTAVDAADGAAATIATAVKDAVNAALTSAGTSATCTVVVNAPYTALTAGSVGNVEVTITVGTTNFVQTVTVTVA